MVKATNCQMNATNKPYVPVPCAFHDYLEHFATLQQPITIVFKNEILDKVETIEHAIIVDLTGGRNGEFTHLKYPNGEKIIRNDYLISVANISQSNFTGCGL